MASLQLSLACFNYDRTRALFDRRVQVEGCELFPIALEPEETFHRVFQGKEFDLCEMSMSSHTLNVSRGSAEYVAVPAFVSRAFRHSGIYVRSDRGIRSPVDLKGKKVGIPEYQITANVWIRGMLADEYGVQPQDIRWRRGGLENPGRRERSPINLPAGIEVEQLPDDTTLSRALASGELDAVFGAKAPSCYLNGDANVTRLFPDYRRTEQAYFAKTGIFPIMHVVGIRKSLAEKHPWVPASVYKAFQAAKDVATADLGQVGHLAVTLPWGVAEYEDSQRLMGKDYWSYGFEANKEVLGIFTRYHHEQGISSRRVSPEELFTPSTLNIAKN
ncbi:MAG: 4,5-dihydroxyphthalate decarboxylase [Betaproteobacteria bacterium]|nr:4,5-dihydroxyphthalate decarboxylase [Betaproteobacteria bacterium]